MKHFGLVAVAVCLGAAVSSLSACSQKTAPTPARSAAPQAEAWVVGYGAILHSTDGRTGWRTEVSGTAESLNDVTFCDHDHGWAAGDDGTILRTSDGGKSWVVQHSARGQDLQTATCVDPDHAWVAGSTKGSPGRPLLLATTDGGLTWQRERLPKVSQKDVGVSDITFVDAEHGWAVFTPFVTQVLRTSDGGRSWQSARVRGADYLRAVTAIDTRHVWVAGMKAEQMSGSFTARSTDGGQTWTPGRTTVVSCLNDITMVDRLHGWAVGTGGAIVTTADGGKVWTPQHSGWPGSLSAVTFVSPLRGWVITGGTNLLETQNGGGTWTKVSLPGVGVGYNAMAVQK